MAKNIGDFTIDVFQMMALEFNDKAVEEFAKYFIGRPNEWAEIVKRSPLNQKAAGTPVPRPRVEPQYVVHKSSARAAPEAEEKRGILGSLRSFIKKDS
jgi:hypothetical protein